MSRTRNFYTKEFKHKAVELSYAKGNLKQTCKDLDISLSSLSRWRHELKQYGNKNSFPGKGNLKLTDQEREIIALKKELQNAHLENEILKKAVSIFSKSDKKNINL
jgi:transposase